MQTRVTPRSWSAPPPSSTDGRPRGPSPTRAALVSALLPGAGQLVAGWRGRGAALLACAVAGGAGAAWLVLGKGVAGVLAWALQPRVLSGLLVLNLAVALVRGLVTADAWRLASHRARRVGAAHVVGLLVVLTLLIALPHAGVALAGARTQDVLAAVFVAPGDITAPAPTTAPGPSPEPPSVSRGEATATTRPRPDPASTMDDTGPPQTPEFTGEPFDGAGRLTVLLLGGDAGPGRTGTRIDAQVVASIDVATGETVLIGIARNLGDVPLTGVFAERLGDPFGDRLMGLYPAAAGDAVLAATFDDAGAAAHVNAAEGRRPRS